MAIRLKFNDFSLEVSEEAIAGSKLLKKYKEEGKVEVNASVIQCTQEEAEKVIESLEYMTKTIDLIYNFDHPSAHTSIEKLTDLKFEIFKNFDKWAYIQKNRELYHWIEPDERMLRKLEEYSQEINTPAGYFKTHTINTDHSTFYMMCSRNFHRLVKWYCMINPNDKIDVYQTGLYYACINGHLRVAKWLYKHYPRMNTHANDDFIIRTCCANGQEDVVTWLSTHTYGLTRWEAKDNEAMRLACYNGHIGMARFLCYLANCREAIGEKSFRIFRNCCKHGQMEILRWMYYDIGWIDIHAMEDDAFRKACRYGHFEIAKWLYSFGGVDIHCMQDFAFRYACTNGHFEIAKWLYSLDGEIVVNAKKGHAIRGAAANNYMDILHWLTDIMGHENANYWIRKGPPIDEDKEEKERERLREEAEANQKKIYSDERMSEYIEKAFARKSKEVKEKEKEKERVRLRKEETAKLNIRVPERSGLSRVIMDSAKEILSAEGPSTHTFSNLHRSPVQDEVELANTSNTWVEKVEYIHQESFRHNSTEFVE